MSLICLISCRSYRETDFDSLYDSRWKTIDVSTCDSFSEVWIGFIPYVYSDSLVAKYRICEINAQWKPALDSIIEISENQYIGQFKRKPALDFFFTVGATSVKGRFSVCISASIYGSQYFNYGMYSGMFMSLEK